MYVREKKVRRGEKTYSYWQLVEGRRVDGRVRQRVVAHLGALPDRGAAKVAARAAGLLCGADGCGQRGVEECTARTIDNRDSVTLLLCSEHAGELGRVDATLRAVAYRG